MSNGPGTYHDENSGRKWTILIIFLLLVGFAATAVWFWINQERPSEPVELAQVGHPALAPLAPPEVLDRPPLSDAEAVAEGTLSRFDDDRWLESDSFVGTDAAGRTATLRIYILSENYAWVFGDGTSIAGPSGPADLRALFSGGDFQDRFCTSASVLAIGTSSFEGPQAINHRLARSRGKRLVSALSEQLSACGNNRPELLAASLGEHAETSPCPGRDVCPEATSSQRRLILVGVETGPADGGQINYDEALWSGMRQFATEQENFFRDFRLADYDRFELLD